MKWMELYFLKVKDLIENGYGHFSQYLQVLFAFHLALVGI